MDAAPMDADATVDTYCKAGQGSAPEITIGQGQNDYLPLSDLETVQVEQGPQGGHHIWVAIRMKNLMRSGSHTVISGVAPELSVTVAPLDVIFTFEPSDGGYCILFGLRYQLDARGVDYVPLLGKELDLSATVTDPSDSSAQGTKRVTLSKDVI
jgi:hypothetical protein